MRDITCKYFEKGLFATGCSYFFSLRNEAANMLGKEAAARPSVNFLLSVPHPHIERDIRAHFMKELQNHCDYSDKGRHTYDLAPAISLDLLLLTPSTRDFLTGHGPFEAFLFKFKDPLPHFPSM